MLARRKQQIEKPKKFDDNAGSVTEAGRLATPIDRFLISAGLVGTLLFVFIPPLSCSGWSYQREFYTFAHGVDAFGANADLVA
jgi:hypothetical protein